MTVPIKTDVFRGSVHSPERDERMVALHAETVSQYYVPTPVGGANKEEVRQVISTPRATAAEKAAHDIEIPERASDDAPTLYAWYGPYGWCENYRKVVLAQCREIERAKAAASGTKTTEARLEDLARLNPIYLDFLRVHLKGRQDYEHAFLLEKGIAA